MHPYNTVSRNALLYKCHALSVPYRRHQSLKFYSGAILHPLRVEWHAFCILQVQEIYIKRVIKVMIGWLGRVTLEKGKLRGRRTLK